MKKKAFSIFLAAVLVACLLPGAALAAIDDVLTVDGIKYRVISETGNTGTVRVGTQYPGSVQFSASAVEDTAITSVSLPDSITSGGITYAVTEIANCAFYECANLASVTLPDGVTSIGARAFQGCTSLASIVFPPNLNTIGNYAFSGCTNLNTLIFFGSAAPSRSIGDGLFMSAPDPSKLYYPVGGTGYTSGYFAGKLPRQITVEAAYFVTATAGVGGRIEPNGTIPCDANDRPAFSFIADSDYILADVVVDGTSVDGATALGSYTFDSLTGRQTIHATFSPTSQPPPGAPAITGLTADKTVPATVGKPVTLTVQATNATAYQWRINRGSGVWEDISGATNASYTTAPVTKANNGYQYYCLVSNGIGAIEGPVFTLNVVEPADIPKAGDRSMPGLWLAVLLLSAGALAASALLGRRKRHGN